VDDPIGFKITVREDLRSPEVEKWLKEVEEMMQKDFMPSLRIALAVIVGSEFL
jgi:hypothetical protein